MLGAVIKSYYAEKNRHRSQGHLSLCPSCPVRPRSSRAQRPELSNGGLQDVDAVITTRELARMIKEAGIDFVNLPDESFDAMLGESTGAADIFGATGGVMEAALRTVADILDGQGP